MGGVTFIRSAHDDDMFVLVLIVMLELDGLAPITVCDFQRVVSTSLKHFQEIRVCVFEVAVVENHKHSSANGSCNQQAQDQNKVFDHDCHIFMTCIIMTIIISQAVALGKASSSPMSPSRDHKIESFFICPHSATCGIRPRSRLW